jgi:hypothetical protein
MNVTLVAALALLVLWIVLAFVVAIPSGWVHLCYAGAVMLLVRRVLVGAPTFRS